MSRPARLAAPVLLAALAGPCSTHAQTPPPPCPQPESAQFDFWIGDWDVFLPDGKQAGTNRIERLYGCVLHEHWTAPKVQGQSFTRWDRDRKVWHQTWVDTTGGLLLIEGRLEEGAMVLKDATNEVRWTPNADGSVRQLWRATKDGGKTWTVAFDGRYVRSTRPQPK